MNNNNNLIFLSTLHRTKEATYIIKLGGQQYQVGISNQENNTLSIHHNISVVAWIDVIRSILHS